MHPRRFAGTMAGGALILCGLLSLSGTSIEPDFRKVEPRLLHARRMATRPSGGKAIGVPSAESTAVPVFIRTGYDDPSLPERIVNLGGSANRVAPRIYAARLTSDSLRYASNWPSVSYIEAGRRLRPLLDRSRPAVSADIVQAGTGLPGGAGYTGQGSLVGIVDTGMDGTHPDFSAGSPPASRVVHTFSFSRGESALADPDGHGTHVAGIAAGNGRGSGGLYTGMASRSDLMIARAGAFDFTDASVIEGIADLFAYAESVSKPAAVNLSLGSMEGPHDGTSSFESTIDFLAAGAAGSRRLVAVASGNEQDKNEHFRAVIPPFGASTASLSLLPGTLSGTAAIDVWADGEDRYSVTGICGGESLTVASGSSGSTRSGAIRISNKVDAPPNQGTHIQVFFASPDASAIPASIRFDRVRNGGGGKIDAYVEYTVGNFTGTGASASGTTVEPANGENVIAVGSFQTKTVHGGAGTAGISSFSSIGPTRDGRIKPDVAAPGEVIYSARSSQSNFSSFEIAPNDTYAILAGTSMAAPHAAGVAALVWESDPSLTGARMRERLRRTASLPTDGSTPPNTTWGNGKLSALRAVRNTVAAISAPAHALPGAPIPLSSENSSGGLGAPISGYLWTSPGAVLATPNRSATTLTASTPGIYSVSLVVTAGGSSGTDSRNIVVNTPPVAGFAVPAAESAGKPVTFRGTASDADSGQTMTRRWLVVSRPAGSAASISAASPDNAVFTPDVAGTYEIGLRADDGMDNSALVVHTYTTLNSTVEPPSSSPSGGGGGGCLSITRSGSQESFDAPLFSALILLLPALVLRVRRRINPIGIAS